MLDHYNMTNSIFLISLMILVKVRTLQIVHVNDKEITDLPILHRLPIRDLPILQY